MSVVPKTLDRKTIVKIAALASVDERTVRGCLSGKKKTLPPVAEAIHATMRALGLEKARP